MLRIAVIGAGRIGFVHARTIAAHPDAQLVTIADPMGDSAARLASDLHVASTTNPDDVFAAADVDAVVICSPTPLHVDHLLAAARAGKKVLCEKPVDLDIARVDDCIAQLAGLDATVMLGFNRRFDPTFAEIHARVAAGDIGEVQQVTIVSRDPQAPPASYVAQSGGIFRDMTIHDFDMARHFIGDVVEVHAVGQNWDAGIAAAGDFDQAVVTLRGASGAVATIVNSRHCAFGYDQRLEAFGPLGALQADNQLATSVRFAGAQHAEATSPYLDFFLQRYADAYRLELSEFIACVNEHRTPTPSILDGRAALVLADAATESARTGAVVRVAS